MNTKTRGIGAYLLITFGVAWLDWAMAWRLGVVATSFLFQLFSLPASFSPALAAIIVRRWITREGFADAGWKLHFRRTWPYYLFAWLLPLPVIGVLLVLAPAFGLGQADLTLHRGLSILSPGLQLPAGGAWLVLGQLLFPRFGSTGTGGQKLRLALPSFSGFRAQNGVSLASFWVISGVAPMFSFLNAAAHAGVSSSPIHLATSTPDRHEGGRRLSHQPLTRLVVTRFHLAAVFVYRPWQLPGLATPRIADPDSGVRVLTPSNYFIQCLTRSVLACFLAQLAK